jgi:Tfp pilus assembly protein FimV
MTVASAAPSWAGHAREARPGRARRSADAVRPAPVRLTRRGRLVLIVLVLVALVPMSWVGLRHASVAAGARDQAPPARHVTVRQGETMWAIATRLFPHADPRETVQRIIDMNGRGPTLMPGDVITVPSGS